MKEAIPGNLIITIDGPSGAGKSTVAKMLARALHYTYIDTGAMYRGVACAFARRREAGEVERRDKREEGRRKREEGRRKREEGRQQAAAGRAQRAESRAQREEDSEEMAIFLKNLKLRFAFGEETRVYLNGHDISKEIREPAISMLASKLSQSLLVRNRLYEMQRSEGRNGGVVLEGRDTGSVVFPDAHIKFYLDARPEVRAGRRHRELSVKGAASDLATVEAEMIKRDRDDSERSIAPLVVPEGAVSVDTTGLDPDGVVALLLKHVVMAGKTWK